METRKLGKTGHQVTIFALGGESAIKGEDDHDEAIEILNEALDKGVNYIDTAPAYGPKTSEERIGEIIKDGRREEFYLATKCDKRNNEQAWKQINSSIERLGSEPDCIQIHHIDTMDEVKKIFSKNGAIKALKRAKKEKLCKYLGITGHSDPLVLLEALSKYKFDTVLGSLNIADPFYYSFQTKLIPYCEENDIGFIAMKTCARGNLFKKGRIYEMKDALNYVWSVPGVSTAIVGISNIEQLRANIDAAKNHKKLSEEKMRELEKMVEPYFYDALYFRKDQSWDLHREEEELPQFVL
jgi:aryl-alcohol dehydrogenase-like predicted oxidoreductase